MLSRYGKSIGFSSLSPWNWYERTNFRASLGTHTHTHTHTHTRMHAQEMKQIFEINRGVLGSCLNGKEQAGLSKLSTVISLASPVTDIFMEHTNFLESIAFKLCRYFQYHWFTNKFWWFSHGWTANKGIVSAIVDISYQVIDVFIDDEIALNACKLKGKKQTANCLLQNI